MVLINVDPNQIQSVSKFIEFNTRFWSGPVVILFCNYLVQDFVRQFVAFITQSGIAFIGHFIFLVKIFSLFKVVKQLFSTNQIIFKVFDSTYIWK